MKWIEYQKKLGLGFDDNRKMLRFYALVHNHFKNAPYSFFNSETEKAFCDTIGVCMAANDDPLMLFGDQIYGLERAWFYLSKHETNFLDFLSCCVALVNAYSEQEKDIKQWLKTTILDSLDDCQINYELLSDADGIFIFPKGAKELDDALVSEPLDWLKEYPQARIAFTKALKEYSEATTTNASDIADKFRKALETFFQEFFGGGRSLEKYVTDHTYEQYLNQRGIPTELRDEFKNTVTAYYKFINNNAKHHDRTEVNILEYLMYQTGNIIRLLITLKQEEDKHAD